jgi:hypothetical protein
MSAKNDVQRGLRATLHVSRDEIVAACTRAADVLGKHASASNADGKVVVRIYPGLSQKLSSVSPVVGITLSPTDQATLVTARVEHYRTLQSRLFFVIPFGPKQLVGRSTYANFLTSLRQELLRVDPAGDVQITTAI